MTASEIVRRVIAIFDRLKIPYMAVGSFSVNMYADPRSTKDADFVVQMDSFPLDEVVDALGSEFSIDRQMSFESIRMTNRYKIEHRLARFSIEIFGLADDPHDQVRFARRVSGSIDGLTVYVPTAEDVVIQKLRWYARGKRSKDRVDAMNVIATNMHDLDQQYMRHWCGVHGTLDLLNQLFTDLAEHDEGNI